jgi:hypothetical protein
MSRWLLPADLPAQPSRHAPVVAHLVLVRRHSLVVMLRLFLILLAAVSALASDALETPALLSARPEGKYVRVSGGDIRNGFIIWTPTLTLSDVVRIAGGLAPKAQSISIDRLAINPSPDLAFLVKDFFRDPKIQNQRFDPGDRIKVDHIIPPW